jgi:hypothetical protein
MRRFCNCIKQIEVEKKKELHEKFDYNSSSSDARKLKKIQRQIRITRLT